MGEPIAGGDDRSAAVLLVDLRARGFELQAAGEILQVRPADQLTPSLHAELVRRKAGLLRLLAAPVQEYVHLKGGLTLPLAVVQLGWHLEDRGFRLTLDRAGVLHTDPEAGLTADDKSAIQRWRNHLAVLTQYCDELA